MDDNVSSASFQKFPSLRVEKWRNSPYNNANEHKLMSLIPTAKAIQKTTNAIKMYENANTTLTLLKC